MDETNSIESKWVDFEIKFAHGEGHTVFVINKDLNKLLTGGSDGEVRNWSIEQSDDDPENYDVGSAIYSLTSSVSYLKNLFELVLIYEFKYTNHNYILLLV